jgi:prepilin-type N-terminal cleavage/methylation domain-containing protein/prepilin-type processing-associated H-X9-DG protein
MRRIGFTLIELLVVIAIIAILAAILFPVFARARAKANQTKCLNNVKEIGLAISMYINDYDGMWVNYSQLQTGNPFPNGTGLPGLLMPYVKNYQIFNCPSSMYTSQGSIMATHSSHSDYVASDTVANGNCGPMDQIPYPAECMTTFDMTTAPAGNATQCWADWTCAFINLAGYNNRGPCSYSQCAHNNGVNVSFLDGHAAWWLLDALQNESINAGPPCSPTGNSTISSTPGAPSYTSGTARTRNLHAPLARGPGEALPARFFSGIKEEKAGPRRRSA